MILYPWTFVVGILGFMASWVITALRLRSRAAKAAAGHRGEGIPPRCRERAEGSSLDGAGCWHHDVGVTPL
jgi:hypothetical protein